MHAEAHPPRVAVVIPFYCSDATFVEALDSVLHQTRPADEIIVVDDASPAERAQCLEALNPRVTLIRHEVNGGPAAARQSGADATTAELIAYLDQDDLWLPHKLERQLAFLDRHPALDAVHCGLIEFRANGDERVFNDKPATIDLAESLRINHVMASALLIRHAALDAVGGWPRTRKIAEDHDLNIRMVAAGQRIGFLAEPLVRFRRCGQGNLSSRRWWQMKTNLALIWKHRSLYLQTLGMRRSLAVVGRYIAELGRDPGWLGRCGRLVGFVLGHRGSGTLGR